MELFYFCRYSNQPISHGKSILSTDAKSAVEEFCRRYPSNKRRIFPVFVNWYYQGKQYDEMYTGTRRGVERTY